MGGALAPFLTVLIAQRKGTYVSHPTCVALHLVMLAYCAALTKGHGRGKGDVRLGGSVFSLSEDVCQR